MSKGMFDSLGAAVKSEELFLASEFPYWDKLSALFLPVALLIIIGGAGEAAYMVTPSIIL